MADKNVIYKNEFNKLNYDRLNIIVPKGKKEVIKYYANKTGQSLNSFVIEAIEKRIDEIKSK